MATSQSSMSDASFFSLVHHVLQAHPSGPADSDRSRVTRMQYVAPFVDGRLPEAGQFQAVRCQNLSLSEFAYLADSPPDCEQVIVALGVGPLILMSARVVHHSPTMVDGHAATLVNCQFICRIDAGAAGLSMPTGQLAGAR